MSTATKSNLTLRVDSDVKMQASQILNKLGLNLSTATDIFYRQVIRQNGLPFRVALDDKPNQETRDAIREADQMSKDAHLYDKSYTNFDEMMKDILHED